ncbi:PQQ-dependent dehydrogenase, methanol/ethanol family [Sphingobium boeckii]|uniref:Quinohemoprotein ethanol dehydrogenase n=1 Tax=Sphingobium boeckii TaxID=1082345 RepID=A0A7W9AI31_9SPHN|nr:PQQ-dependent dehydrogenase, methanol/ethanol family [Sphingobium boeckii]MBB5685917.1 quinohemoprotein ethanol dehydrogenase [Sphingobium boeckii]
MTWQTNAGRRDVIEAMKKLTNFPVLLLAALLLPVAACNLTPSITDSDTSVEDGDWPNYGRTGSEQHYSPLNEVTAENIGQLSLAWHFDLEPGFTVSAPVAADGKLFTTTGNSYIRGFDAVTGKLLWEFDAKTRELAKGPLQMNYGNKGIAYWKGRVFLVTTDGRVIALDANNGKPVWEQREYSLDEMRNTNGPPRIFGGKLIIGHGGADISPIRGYVTAYDAMTGKRLWRFYTVPGDPSKPADTKAEQVSRPTWKGDWFGKGGGGTAWNSFSYDPKLNLMYIGVGNGFPYNPKLRSPGGGDNLFLASIVAVNADTGAYVWHYQVCPQEGWDCTATMDMTLADITIDGKLRQVLMQAPKNGFFYVIDRKTGELLSAEKFAKATWADRIDMKTGRPVENPGIRYQDRPGMFELWPGPQGAHSWLPQAYSPRTGLVYIPVIEMGALIGPAPAGMTGIGSGMGAMLVADAPLKGSRRSFLKAWDPIKQKAAWQIELPGVWPGGVLATAGDLIFQGRIDGQLVAYDAKTGKQVWSYKTASPIVAPPISYRVKGKQYITVLTGSGSQGGGILASGNAAFRTDYALPRQVLTFAIGGKDPLPRYTMTDRVPVDDPDFRPDAAKAQAGGMAFAMNACIVCHGMNAIGGGAAPDLRYSPMIMDQNAMKAIVKDGALKLNGMPAFPQVTDQQLEDIRYYLRAMAKQAAAGPAGAQAGAPSAATSKGM